MTRPLAYFAAVLSVLGCERAGDQAAERMAERMIASKGREARVEIDRDQGSIRIELGRAVKPKGWPAEVPLDPRARRARIVESSEGRWRLSVTSETSLARIAETYRGILIEAGWEVDRVEEAGLRARRGERRMTVSFAPSQDEGSRAAIELEGG